MLVPKSARTLAALLSASCIALASGGAVAEAGIVAPGLEKCDAIILYSIGRYLQLDETQKVWSFKEAEGADLKSEPSLYFVAHGGVGEVQGRDAKALADMINTSGGGPLKAVYLFSCESGVDASTGGSLASALAAQIKTPGITVIGCVGCSVTDRRLGGPICEWIVLKDKEDVLSSIQEKLEKKHNIQANLEKLKQEFVKVHHREPSVKELATLVFRDPVMRAFFDELIASGEEADCFRDRGRGYYVGTTPK